MANRPSAKMRITKRDGVTFQSNVEHAQWAIGELIDASNRDVGKFIRKEVGNRLVAEFEGTYVKGTIAERRTGTFQAKYARKALQYWARKRDHDLLIGFKQWSWYGTTQELGDYGYPKLGILRNAVYSNIPEIRKIQAQYLTALNSDNPSIPDGEDMSDD